MLALLHSRLWALWFFAAFLGLGSGTSVRAQEDTRVIRLIVGTPPGNGLDILARVILPQLAENIGRTIIVENRPGAGGLVAAQVAAKAAPDGTTLFLGFAGTHGIFSSLYKSLPYDPVRDFAPIVGLTYSANVVVASKVSGFKTIADLVDAARKKPGVLNMGSSGVGTTPHLSGAILNKMAGINTLHIPFKANPTPEVVAGNVDYAFDSTLVALDFIRSGRITALAVTSPQRDPLLPDVPTLAESGFPEYSVIAWSALFAPAKTPEAFIRKVNEAANKVLKDPKVVAQLAQLSSRTIGGTPDDLRVRVNEEIAKWPEIVKEAGAQLD